MPGITPSDQEAPGERAPSCRSARASARRRKAIAQFFATVPAGGRLDQITLVPTHANRQPTVAAYIRDPDGRRATAYGIMVFTIDGTAIGEITGFADPALFRFFGLPGHLEA
jgi:RNA polymerase sigma-70 factor (ECF subfamily)